MSLMRSHNMQMDRYRYLTRCITIFGRIPVQLGFASSCRMCQSTKRSQTTQILPTNRMTRCFQSLKTRRKHTLHAHTVFFVESKKKQSFILLFQFSICLCIKNAADDCRHVIRAVAKVAKGDLLVHIHEAGRNVDGNTVRALHNGIF